LEDDDTDNETLTDLVAGAVGEGLAIKFMAHRKVSSKLPKPEDILAGKNTSTVTDLDLGGYSPKPGDEKAFVAKHKVQKHADRVGNEDDLYQATNVKHTLADPKEKRHGYKKPEDEKVNEDAQCNMSEAGTSCSVHGMKECSSYGGSVIKEKGKEVNEVMSKSAKAGDWINDFVNSDNPKFAGKSKEKRKEMALAAYYAKQRNEEHEPMKGKSPGSKGIDAAKKDEEERVALAKKGKKLPSRLTGIRNEEVELNEISRDLARRVIRKAAGEKEMGYGKKDRTNVLSLAGKKAYPEFVGKPRVPATTEEVELDEDDKHFEKQTPKMQTAINMHLRKGKSYLDAVKAAKVHVKEEVELDEQNLRDRTSRTKAVHVKHPRPDKEYGIKKQMEDLAMPMLGSNDSSKYDDESAEMAKTQLKALANKALNLMMQIPDDMILEPWVQSKINIAKDYVSSVHDYMIYSDKDGIKKDVEKESDTAGAMQFPGVNVDSAGYNI
jgi:hypothetical protein